MADPHNDLDNSRRRARLSFLRGHEIAAADSMVPGRSYEYLQSGGQLMRLCAVFLLVPGDGPGSKKGETVEIDSLKKRLVGIDRSVLAITEMCERRAPTGVHTHLFSIQRDARRLESLLGNETADTRCAECLEHLKEAGRELMNSCARVDHKDTRTALEDLTTILIALPHPGTLHH